MSLADLEGRQRAPRVAPGLPAELGWRSRLILALLARAARTDGPPNLPATLARQRRLFGPWLRFAAALMPGGSLPRADTELVILRVAHNCRSEYEWAHHARIAREVGLSAAQVAAVRRGFLDQEAFTPRQELLLRAADELHTRRQITDRLWSRLARELGEVELIELPMLVGHYEMLAMTINTLRVQPDRPRPVARRRRGEHVDLAGTRVLITGAAGGIGAATARRLHSRGADVVLAGLEPEALARVAAECGDALAVLCDLRDREQVEAAVEAAVEQLDGLDVVVATAGVAAQLLRAAALHIAHPRGYALAVASLAAAVHPPPLSAHGGSKTGVEAIAEASRAELAGSGARVGVAYIAELDGHRTSRGFAADAVSRLGLGRPRSITPIEAGVDAIERAIVQRSRRVVAPPWVAAVLPLRGVARPLIDRMAGRTPDDALDVERLTTELPDDSPLADRSRARGG